MVKAIAILLVAAVIAISQAAPADQKTTIEVKERVDRYPVGDVKTQSGTITHDVVGGKNWGAGGYITHERMEFPGGGKDKNTHGGFQINAKF